MTPLSKRLTRVEKNSRAGAAKKRTRRPKKTRADKEITYLGLLKNGIARQTGSGEYSGNL